jgi:2,3-dihydroxybiphenyl 1,2-dioxygenase
LNASISNLGYVVLGVSDLAKWEHFAVDIVGAAIGQRDGERSIGLRMDEYEQRVQLVKSRDDDLVAAGWDLTSETQLEQFVRDLRQKDVAIRDGGRELAAERRVERVFICDDPNGVAHELYYGLWTAPMSEPFRSKVLTNAGFETGRLGVGHFLQIARNYDESVAFYRDLLGLRITDYIRQKDFAGPGMDIEVTFLHAAAGRHHSAAVTALPFPKRIHHLMFQMQSMNDVGLALDRCVASGVRVLHGLGHHANNRSTSFYVESPSGFAFEFAWGGVVVDDLSWEITTHPQISAWGHRSPGSAPR